MTPFLIALSGIITISAAIPYMIEIVKGKAKPRVVSWITWALITGIASAASFADGHYASGVLMLCVAIQVSVVAILGFKHGDRKFDRLDVVCQIGAIVGLILWFIFKSPTVAILATITIDLIGAIPTLKHAWLKPHEETWLTYALNGVGGGLTVMIAGSSAVTAIAYPIYVLVIDVVIVAFILRSPYRRTALQLAPIFIVNRFDDETIAEEAA